MTPIEEWTSRGLFAEIEKIHNTMPDRAFAFVLGAGASVSSGIPAGYTLAKGWLEELHHRCCLGEASFEEWLASGGPGVAGLSKETIAQYYPQIFEKRFGRDPDSGFAALEQLMERAEPNLGYSLLAEIVDQTRHKVVITTNFDNLVADALAIHASKPPLIVGHESLAGFARPRLRRPLVAKIHRDLMLSPINDSNGTNHLEGAWAEALQPLFQSFTPLFIGYGGNDGSLMQFLNALPPRSLPGRPIWCKRKDTVLPESVQQFLTVHSGIICTISGFDEFMFPLVGKLLPHFDLAGHCDRIEKLGKQRSENLRKQAEWIQQSNSGDGGDVASSELRENLSASLKDADNWWTWEMRARSEKDPKMRESVYRQGLKHLPRSADLAGNYAIFLTNTVKDYEGAERLYKRALELDPTHARHMCNYAIFLKNNRNDYEGAEKLYKSALELDPTNARYTVSFAHFLKDNRKDYEGAERLYKRALELDPTDARIASNYSLYLKNIRRDYEGAEGLYKRALELDPTSANITGNYCQLLLAKGDRAKGVELLKRAFTLQTESKALLAELWFYALAHFPSEYPDAEQRIRALLAQGAKSEGWDFRDNISRAEMDGHANIPLLKELADAISDSTIHSQ